MALTHVPHHVRTQPPCLLGAHLVGCEQGRRGQGRRGQSPRWCSPGGSASRRGRSLFPSEFEILVRRVGLPSIRFHDLRHCLATFGLATGVDMKEISAMLGHSRHSFTADTYASVLPEPTQAAAEATVAISPRRSRRTGS
ncbi:tyrosine-type recombinase/integrase [Sinosporangium album]|uniref:tyrosine-type recombinase/integrase n=1 Tax=Sinosporangium album TaxID=504805 RepID=UPI003B830F09